MIPTRFADRTTICLKEHINFNTQYGFIDVHKIFFSIKKKNKNNITLLDLEKFRLLRVELNFNLITSSLSSSGIMVN